MDMGRIAFLRTHGSRGGKVMPEDELQWIYDSEINVRISWLWDGGIDVRLGDEMNRYLAEENVSSTGHIVSWLQESIAHFYPDSTYAKSLDPHQRAGWPSAIPTAHQWRAGAMPELRRATCSLGWHGGGVRVCLLALRERCQSTAAKADVSVAWTETVAEGIRPGDIRYYR